MKNDAELFTLESALAFVKYHFTEGGLIKAVEIGEIIDESEFQMLEAALRTIHHGWLDKILIPKQDVRILWNVLPRLEKCLSFYPEKEAEISNFIVKLSGLLDGLFSTQTMSEENAITVVSQHVIGPSFVIGLRFGEINDDSFEELRTALETLAQKWKEREYVSKIAAGAMISIQDLFALISGIYSEDEKRRLQPMVQELNECITKCLS